jgi:hypothetical protein
MGAALSGGPRGSGRRYFPFLAARLRGLCFPAFALGDFGFGFFPAIAITSQ